VEIVRAGLEAYNRRDYDAAVKDFASDVAFQFDALTGGEMETEFRGREAVKNFWADVNQHFERFSLEPSGFRDAGEVVFYNARFHGIGQASGVPAEMTLHAVTRFQDGQVAQIRYYADEREALKAAGLSE
jgi:ketosteroid isomerase-like protein